MAAASQAEYELLLEQAKALTAGESDWIANTGNVSALLKAGMKNVALTLFDGSRHEFLNERVRRGETYNALLSFFERTADGSASRPSPHNGNAE